MSACLTRRATRLLHTVPGTPLFPPESSQIAALPAALKYSYYVPRNSRNNLPVYTDIRNGGSRYLVMIRNVDGQANVLAKDLAETLFEKGSPEAARMEIQIDKSKNLILTGGRWRNHVVHWLKSKGF